MYRIKDQEIDFIVNDITKQGILTEDVRDNILDHVCCIIESEMKEEENFYEFYRNTIARFYNTELSEIEDETQILLTFKNFRAMKRTLKISGIISTLLIVLGIFFKTQHIMGAGIILFSGLILFSLVFVPLNIFLKFKDDKKGSNRTIMTIGLITVSITTISVLFKLMHWPYGGILMQSSLAVFVLIFVPLYFFTRFKDPDTKFNAIIHSTFMIAGAGMLYALMYAGNSYKYIPPAEETDSTAVEISYTETAQSNLAVIYYSKP